jgi:HK97 family phage portal protein
VGIVRDLLFGPKVEREITVTPLEGTNMSLFHSIIPSWWSENGLSSSSWLPGNAQLADRVWVANRCIQLNSQQVASMPLHYHGGFEPAWVSSPDPHWYPNGIGDALHSIVALLYGWGYACLYVTDTYADGFPRTWTVLDSSRLSISVEDGQRRYRFGQDEILDPRRVIQIDRNPGVGPHGSSALRAYWQAAWGLLAAGNQSMNVNQGGIPQAVLKSQRKLTKEQAEALQEQWVTRMTARSGPPVLPPELDFETISFNPADLALLDTQEFNAKAIATAFGVPAVLLNMSVDGFTYQNPGALGEMWWRFELRPTATRIANALSAQMLPRGQWVDFDAADTFLPLDEMSGENDTQNSQVPNSPQPITGAPGVAKASPAQQPRPLTAIGGGA